MRLATPSSLVTNGSLLLLLSLLSVLLAPSSLAQPLDGPSSLALRDLGPVTIYTPPSNYTAERTLYARSLVLSDQKTILTTWENYDPTEAVFPIYKSVDGGKRWSQLSSVKDQVNGWGLRYQPFLYELPSAFGGFPKGTILLAGNSIPKDLSQTQLDLYASTDRGVTWRFVSHIAAGGVALPNNGETPMWEPFLLLHEGEMICYYSDQRDPRYGQKMVHQRTRDLRSWGEVVDDVTSPVYDHRPGMPTVAALPNGEWLMSYEFHGAVEGSFSVYYKLARDPREFGKAEGKVLRATDGTVPVGSPYVIWSPAGGQNGTLVLDAASGPDLYINKGMGQAGSRWERVSTKSAASYTRSLAVGLHKDREVYIVGGGQLGQGPTNKVTFEEKDL